MFNQFSNFQIFRFFKFIIFLFFLQTTHAQQTFIDNQLNYKRVGNAYKLKEDSLKKEFALKKIPYPPRQMYLRSFKYDSQLEVWVKDSLSDTFKLLKTYKVCALSGNLGPKRMEGDYQVPEGFYCLNEFNPKSQFHLSLGVNYPNASDEILSDSVRPGGDIYIHGKCVTTGCIPIKDDNIEELYLLASQVVNAGQDFIPLHIFPVQYNNLKSFRYLALMCKDNLEYQKFAVNLQEAYEYFNIHKKIPRIATTEKGDYVFLWKM